MVAQSLGVAVVLAVALALLPGTDGGGTPLTGGTAHASTPHARFRAAMIAMLNRVRARHGIPAVRGDRRMARAARAHSRTMAGAQALFHGAWSGRVARAARARWIGEVLACIGPSRPRREARTAVRAWLRSPGHRAVLLNPAFRRVGVGRAVGRMGAGRCALYTVDWASRR